MPMKQTQTKLFDFSDAGLDFCSGSKNLFPDRFKKMLNLGYNIKTVTTVNVLGDQVTFTYDGPHGYVADRVIKVSGGALSLINSGEFWIDSVTANTITLTIDDAPPSISGAFTTCIAPLGWELVYELNHIHIYKFKNLNGTDIYARLCFLNTTATWKNSIAVGLGHEVDLENGLVLDAAFDLGSCEDVRTATANFRWDFTYNNIKTFDNYTYSQGFSEFGKGSVVGSLYHLFIAGNAYTDDRFSYIYGIFPFVSSVPSLNYPALLTCYNTSKNGYMGLGQVNYQRIFVGAVDCLASHNTQYTFPANIASSSFYPPSIEPFNVTGCFPVQLFTRAERQPLGFIAGGLYQVCYTSADKPSPAISNSPSITADVEFYQPILVHSTSASINTPLVWLCSPVEEIKIVS